MSSPPPWFPCAWPVPSAFALALLSAVALAEADDLPAMVMPHDSEAAAVEAEPAETMLSPGPKRLAIPVSCLGAGEDARWFDRAQGYWSERACAPAVWFDRFFGGGRSDDVATALVRVIPSFQYSDREFTETGVRLKAKVRLPQIEQRLSVVINDDDEAETGLLPGEVERPQQANAQSRSSSMAFRYLYDTHRRWRVDADVGLRSELKLLARLRYRNEWTLRPGLQTRFTQSVYFLDGEGFGETSLVEFERLLAEDMLLRWSTQATVSEQANGLELREGLQLLRQVDADRALSWNLAATVNSDPAWKAGSYVTSVRFRQRAFRSWMFFEVEPFIDWIREDRFNTNPGVAFRVEIWLGDTGAAAGSRRPEPEAFPAGPGNAPVDEAPAEAGGVTSPMNVVPPGEP